MLLQCSSNLLCDQRNILQGVDNIAEEADFLWYKPMEAQCQTTLKSILHE
jgi:hypothetical protein